MRIAFFPLYLRHLHSFVLPFSNLLCLSPGDCSLDQLFYLIIKLDFLLALVFYSLLFFLHSGLIKYFYAIPPCYFCTLAKRRNIKKRVKSFAQQRKIYCLKIACKFIFIFCFDNCLPYFCDFLCITYFFAFASVAKANEDSLFLRLFCPVFPRCLLFVTTFQLFGFCHYL